MDYLRDFHGEESGDKLLQHMKWITERFERMNEQLISLSATFIGFLAVELALLAQLDNSDLKNSQPGTLFAVMCVVCLVVSIILFLINLNSADFRITILEDFQKALKLDKNELSKFPLHLMISTEASNDNLQYSFERENKILNKFYRPALIFGFIGQLSLAILVIMFWTA